VPAGEAATGGGIFLLRLPADPSTSLPLSTSAGHAQCAEGDGSCHLASGGSPAPSPPARCAATAAARSPCCNCAVLPGMMLQVIVQDKWKDGANNTMEGGGRKVTDAQVCWF
jgi:hypothetical protein